MIRQLVMNDDITGRQAVGLLLTSADLEDFEIARLGERLLRAGEAAKGHLGRVTYRFEVLDDTVPGLELQTSHIGRTPLLGSHDVLSIDGNKVALVMNDDKWAPWVGQCRPGDDPATPAALPPGAEIVSVSVAETLLGSANPPTPPDAIVAEARSKREAGASDFYTDLVEELADIPYHRTPETRAALDWLKAHYPPLRGVEITSENYQRAVARASYLMGAEAGSPEADELSDLAEVIERYESGPTYQQVLELEHLVDLKEARASAFVDWNRAMSQHEIDNAIAAGRCPCDRVPRWLWPVVAVVGLGLIVAGVR